MISLGNFFGQQKLVKNCRQNLRKKKTISQGSPPAKRSYSKKKWRGENFQISTKLKLLIMN